MPVSDQTPDPSEGDGRADRAADIGANASAGECASHRIPGAENLVKDAANDGYIHSWRQGAVKGVRR